MDLDKLFDLSAAKMATMPVSLLLPETVDTHVHCRLKKTGQMAMVVTACAGEHGTIVDIPNVPSITTIKAMQERRMEILSCVPTGQHLQVLMTPLINDKTDPDMIRSAWDRPDGVEELHGVKIFWQGVSNDYGNSVSSAVAIKPLIQSTTKQFVYKSRPLPVTLHAECSKDYSGNEIPIKDREFWCVVNEVEKIVKMNPEGTYVIRHISDYRTLEKIADWQAHRINIHGEVSPQYVILIDDDLFKSDEDHAMLQCNCIFWPRPKDKRSQLAIRKAALSGVPWLHIGTDYAMHLDDMTQEKGVKINSRGEAVGGLNFLPSVAKSLLIDFFMSRNREDLLAPMLSENAAKLYGIRDIQISDRRIKYIRKDWKVPEYSFGETPEGKPVRSVCFLRGHTMHWQRAA
ncbi:hypothetical protein A2943_00995 [Candidatus Adlerbacteria bacterium RIFCSPLOWO2_01_FULL_51_16]|uniref:Uncharacterized protein n=1 Tax=Candidatus Adlerbacteria bacterium RIFCSPLOWO2_01_FULL_51_16 TaxID=1797243 RepID=A0A1F4XFN5_9BACT|nr:MAG: hypothetical protein A2943_00995 [Candidatus Adlerbacteria bacterium RIFCSPLOWO2_01_FULL_51_16]